MGNLVLIIVIIFLFALVTDSESDIKRKEHEMKVKQDRAKTHEKILEEFRPDKVIRDYENLGNLAIYISSLRKQIVFIDLVSTARTMYYFDELIECSIVEDGVAIESGGVGRAIVGGVLAGGVGAVVGGVLAGGVGAVVGATTRSSKPTTLSLSVRIVARNFDKPLYTISIITGYCQDFCAKIFTISRKMSLTSPRGILTESL